jgi:WD40 repeat protein
LGSATRAYEGKEDADFGGPVDSDRLGPRQGFSPSGKRFAIERRSENVASKVLIWDVPSGKLLSQSQDFFESQLPLVFATDDYVVLDTTVSGPDAALVRIHATSGEADLLRPIGAANGTSGFHQMVVGSSGLLTYIAYAGLNTIDVNSRVHTQAESVSKYRRPLYLATWLSSDKSEFLACSADCLIDRWDVTTGERVSSRTFIPSLPEIEHAWAAPEAGIVAFGTKQNDVHVYDLSTRRRVSLIRVPFRQGKLQAMSSDGKRLIFSTDQRTLLVMQSSEPFPRGMLDLAEVLAKRELAATR